MRDDVRYLLKSSAHIFVSHLLQASHMQQDYMGQNLERCTIGHFQTLSTSITPGSPPVTQKPFVIGIVLLSTIRAFRKHILYIPLLVLVNHTGLQMPKNEKK